MVRVDFAWEEIQPSRPARADEDFEAGRKDFFTQFLTYAKTLKSAKTQKPLKIICVLLVPPVWASQLYLTEKDNFYRHFSNYCRIVAQTFGDRIDYFQIWNEANNPLQPPDFQDPLDFDIDPDFIYKAILKTLPALEKLHLLEKLPSLKDTGWLKNLRKPYWMPDEDVANIFMSGANGVKKGLTQGGNNAQTLINVMVDNTLNIFTGEEIWKKSLTSWLDRIADSTDIDIVGIDHYPETWNLYYTVEKNWKALDDLIGILKGYRDKGKNYKAAIVETGYTTLKLSSHNETDQVPFVRHRLGGLLNKIKAINQKEDMVEFCSFYELYDKDSTVNSGTTLNLPDYENHFGFLRSDFTEKPGFYSLKALLTGTKDQEIRLLHQQRGDAQQLNMGTFQGHLLHEDTFTPKTTTSGPASVFFNNELWCFYRGAGDEKDKLWCARYDCEKELWIDDRPIPQAGISKDATASPAAVVYEGKVFLFYPGTNRGGNNNHLWYSVYDGTTWSSSKPVDPHIKISSGVAPVIYDGKIYILYNGCDTCQNKLCCAIYGIFEPGGTYKFVDYNALFKDTVMYDEPGAVVFQNAVYVFFRNADSLLSYARFDKDDTATPEWPVKTVSKSIGLNRGPAPVVLDNKIWIFHQGIDLLKGPDGWIWYTVFNGKDEFTKDMALKDVKGQSVGVSSRPSAVVVSI